jgi:hypothetical protein
MLIELTNPKSFRTTTKVISSLSHTPVEED